MILLEPVEVLVAEQKACEELAVRPEGGQPEPLWWRVSIREPGGRSVEVDTPSGWTPGEWAAYADRYHGPGCVVTRIAGLPKPRAPVSQPRRGPSRRLRGRGEHHSGAVPLAAVSRGHQGHRGRRHRP